MKVYVDFTITEMAPTYRAFSWLKVPTTYLFQKDTIKTLMLNRH